MSNRRRADITERIIHCAATPNGRDRWSIADVDVWHGQPPHRFRRLDHERAFHRPDLGHVGYHFTIDVHGKIEQGRHLLEMGAHCLGHNRQSIGICLFGTDQFTVAQWDSLTRLCLWLDEILGPMRTFGHRRFDSSRRPDGCPGFNVHKWVEDCYRPPAGHICEVLTDG